MRLLPPPSVTPRLTPRTSTDTFRTLTYRRHLGTDIWHYHPRCSQWLGEDYDEQRETPFGRSFCQECDRHIESDYVKRVRRADQQDLAVA